MSKAVLDEDTDEEYIEIAVKKKDKKTCEVYGYC